MKRNFKNLIGLLLLGLCLAGGAYLISQTQAPASTAAAPEVEMNQGIAAQP